MTALRALYLLPAASFGGAERQAAQAISLLPRFGVEVVPVVGPGRRIVEFLEDAGVARSIFRADLPDDPKAPRGALERARLTAGYVRSYLRLVEALAAEARRERVELIFASRPFAWVVGGMVGERLRLPVVWRAGTHFEHWSHPLLLGTFARARPPRAMVYTSSAVLRGFGAVVPAPAFVVHNGVDLERFAPERVGPAAVAALLAGAGLAAGGPGGPIVGYIGRIAPEKGTALFLRLCRALLAREPSLRVLVAGDSGWRGWLEARLREAGLAEAVRLLGFVRGIERVYAASDVVVSTSAAEGCPNALLEAMAMGRPVVATRVGGTQEVVRHGVDGLLVEPDDVEGFAAEVLRLLASAERRRALGEAAARHVAERFALVTQVARLAEVIAWAAGRPARERRGRGASARLLGAARARLLATAAAGSEARAIAAEGPRGEAMALPGPGGGAGEAMALPGPGGGAGEAMALPGPG